MMEEGIIMHRGCKFLLAAAIMLIIGGIVLYYPYGCSKKIVNAIHDDNITMEDFGRVVNKNKNGINSLRYLLPIWEVLDEPNYYPIHYACKSGQYEKVEVLLDAGADPNVRDHTTNSTPLLFALQSGKSNRFLIANLLLDNGANPSDEDKWSSPLFSSLIIVENDNRDIQERQSVSLLKRLMKTVVSIDDPSGTNTLLGEAASFGNLTAMKYIMDNQINDVNDASEIGRTSLMSSVFADDEEICQLLIDKGADKNLKDIDGKTAYDYAIELNRPNCAKVCQP